MIETCGNSCGTIIRAVTDSAVGRPYTKNHSRSVARVQPLIGFGGTSRQRKLDRLYATRATITRNRQRRQDLSAEQREKSVLV